MKKIAALALALLVLCAAPAARADEPRRDVVAVPITVEGWIATETAEVDIAADLTLVDQDPEAVRVQVMDVLRKLDIEAAWRVTQFNRSQDASGARRWAIRAGARVPQSRLDVIAARARQAATPGRNFRVARIDTSPSLEEREAALRDLRARIYKAALAEVPALRLLWPGRELTVQRIDFDGGMGFTPMVREDARAASYAAAPAPGNAAATERRLVLRALVTIGPAAPAR